MLWFSFKIALIDFDWQLLSIFFILKTSRTHAYFSCYTRFMCTSSAFWYYSVSKDKSLLAVPFRN